MFFLLGLIFVVNSLCWMLILFSIIRFPVPFSKLKIPFKKKEEEKFVGEDQVNLADLDTDTLKKLLKKELQ